MATDPRNEPVRGIPNEDDRARKVLRAALFGVEEAVLFVHAEGREIVGCNPAAVALFGYDGEELLGRSTEMLHTSRERFEEFGRIGEAVLARRETFRTAREMRRKDGSVFPSSHTVSLIDENLGLEGGAVSIIRRRSDVDSAASRLRELEEHYKVLFDESPEPMCVYDRRSLLLLAVNRVLADLYGGRPEDLRGRPLVELLVESAKRQALELFRQSDPGGRRFGTWRARRRDGSVRVLNTSSSAVTFDGRPARLVVATDVTDRLEAEARARRMLSILNATPDLIGIAGRDESVQYLNPAGLRLLGKEDVDPATTTISDHMTAESMSLLREEAIPTAMMEGSWTGETRVRHRDGTEIPVSQVVIHHSGEAGEEYLSTIARDLRERRHLEDQFRQAQKMEAVGQLAGGIAHDFNNILTAILGYAELARLHAGEPDHVRRHLGEVLAGARRATDLTSQLLAFGRRQTLEPQVLDLDRLVTETEGMLRRMIEEKVQIRTSLSGGGARVEADPAHLQQVLLNLAVNARDAMPRGGTLGIETDVVTLERPRRTDGGTVAPGAFAVLRVSDTGLGMDRDVLDRIFEPFFTTKEAGHGTGLGLSTVYGIVRQSGGFVDVESEPGHGSTFAVHLPRSTAEPETDVRPRPVVPDELRASGTVVLVEDDPAVRTFLREILETAGYRVIPTSSADEALEHQKSVAAGEVDLLIADVGLPGMDGRELAEHMVSSARRLPVLLISGYSYPALAAGTLPESMRLLQKPFTAQDLLEAVRGMIESPSG